MEGTELVRTKLIEMKLALLFRPARAFVVLCIILVQEYKFTTSTCVTPVNAHFVKDNSIV